MWTILWRFKSEIAIILLLASVFGYGAYKGYSVEHDKLVAETTKYDKLVQQIDDERKEWKDKITKLTEDANKDNAQINKTFAARMATQHNNYERAITQLRNDVKRASLKPAEIAPAECTNYEASPVQLPVRDAEVALWVGAEANRLAETLRAAQQYITIVGKEYAN